MGSVSESAVRCLGGMETTTSGFAVGRGLRFLKEKEVIVDRDPVVSGEKLSLMCAHLGTSDLDSVKIY